MMTMLCGSGCLTAALLLISLSCLPQTQGFSDGRKLSQGSAATRKIYCNRPPSRRTPLHFHPDCGGFCAPRLDFDEFYTLNISNTTYWLDVVKVNITAKPESGKAVTGFSIYAIDESDHVAGSFVEDDTDVLVGSCNDIITVTDETHAGFHRMADHDRKNISMDWQPDGMNHGMVKFVLWVVNNHSDVYYAESAWLTSLRNGSKPLDVVSNLNKVMSAVNIDQFVDTFTYRSRKGYQLDLPNPFAPFAGAPSENEFVPLNSLVRKPESDPVAADNSQTEQNLISGPQIAHNTSASVPDPKYVDASNQSTNILSDGGSNNNSNRNANDGSKGDTMVFENAERNNLNANDKNTDSNTVNSGNASSDTNEKLNNQELFKRNVISQMNESSTNITNSFDDLNEGDNVSNKLDAKIMSTSSISAPDSRTTAATATGSSAILGSTLPSTAASVDKLTAAAGETATGHTSISIDNNTETTPGTNNILL